MSLIEDKIKMFAIHGIGLITGETIKGKSTSRILIINLKDKRFKTAVMERLKTDGFIQTAEDNINIGKLVEKAIDSEREI
jgi:hypothetical protein